MAYKKNRILDMYSRLTEGKLLNKAEEAEKFGVDERTIQRDIDEIRSFLSERAIEGKDNRSVEYDRLKKAFLMVGDEGSMMSNSEILAVSKILLGSRAFSKKDVGIILDKLVKGCAPIKNMKLVSDLIGNEKYHYIELKEKAFMNDKLWALGESIKEREILEIAYRKQVKKREKVKRLIEPVGLQFSEYYFYLYGFLVEEKEGRYEHLYDFPAIFRVDRLLSFRKLGKKFEIDYKNRFEEGEFRKKLQFMFSGKLKKVTFSYEGSSVDAILDRIPTAKVVEEEGEKFVIEAEVYGKGILRWLLGQGKAVEVLKPSEYREEMREMIEEMGERYEE